jgi:outer membrane lipoprotein-sorting protein
MTIPKLFLCTLASIALLPAESVDAILNRMDKAAPAFHGMSATVQMTYFTAIISDRTEEQGLLQVQRDKAGKTRAKVDFSKTKDPRIIEFLGNVVRIVFPNLKLYQDYDVGKSSDLLTEFLLLGFGSSGKELAHSYDISAEGAETVAGQTTTKLLLVPKNPKVKEHLSKIEMWLPATVAYPVQQQFYEPSGNYRIVTYTDVDLSTSSKGNLEFKLPKGAKRRSS